MSRRNGSGASLLGALLIIGFVGWVLSQIWVYLIVGGALALLGWIGWVASRHLDLPRTIRLLTVDTPRLAPAPEERFRALLPVDPAVFDDSVLAETAALKIFAAWTRDLPMAPSNPSDLVRSLELRVRHIGRLVSNIAHRQVVWREASYGGSAPASGPRLAAEAVDPWTITPEALRRASQYVSSCGRCASDGKATCNACSGTTKVQCDVCAGAGKAYGYASNGSHRLMNCKSCKGKGELRCTLCDKGKVTCPGCHGTGHLERWLEIAETVRHDVQIEPDGQMTAAFRWGTDGTASSRAEVEADAKIVYEMQTTGPFMPADIARAVPSGWMDANWSKLAPALKSGETVQAQTFWLLEVPSIELSYAVARATPTVISFEGRRMLAPPASIDQQFAARAQKVRLTRYAVIGICAAVPIAYLFRGSYYWSGWLVGLTFSVSGLAVATDGFVRQSTLGRQSARKWAIATTIAAVLGCVFAIGAEPSARSARRYIARGDLERAKLELAALGRSNDRSSSEVSADLHLAQVRRTSDAGAAAREAAQIPDALPQRAAANASVYGIVKESVERALADRQPARAESILDEAAPALGPGSPNAISAQAAQLRARIRDQEFDQCASDDCRWKAAFLANQSAPSTARSQRLTEARAGVLAALALRPLADDAIAARLERADALLAEAASLADFNGDPEVSTKAREATAWAAHLRGSIPIIGSDRAIAADLLGVSADTNGSTFGTQSGHVGAYCAVRSGHCAGVYLVANGSGARVLNDGAHATATTRFLSQALGHATSLPDPPQPSDRGSTGSTKWRDHGVAIAARWRGADLVELRVGDAQP